MTSKNEKSLVACFDVMGDAAEIADIVSAQIRLDVTNTSEMMKCLYDMTTAFYNVMDLARDVCEAEANGQDAGIDERFLKVNREKVSEWAEKYKRWDSNYIFPQAGPVPLSEYTDSGKPTAEEMKKADDDLMFYDRAIDRAAEDARIDRPYLSGDIDRDVRNYQIAIGKCALEIAKLEAEAQSTFEERPCDCTDIIDTLDNVLASLYEWYCHLYEKCRGEMPPAEQERRAHNAKVQAAKDAKDVYELAEMVKDAAKTLEIALFGNLDKMPDREKAEALNDIYASLMAELYGTGIDPERVARAENEMKEIKAESNLPFV